MYPPMSTRNRHFSEIAVQPLLFLIICALLDTSDQILSKPSSEECFRQCLARSQSSITKVSRVFSCYHKCLNGTTKEKQGLFKTILKQRTRKALVANPDCPDSSPSQSVDWRPKEVNVSFGQYQNTSYWYVNVSWTSINDTYGNWTGILVRLVVPYSNPTWMTHVNCSVHPTNQTFLRINISSYHYNHPGSIFLNVLAVPFSHKQDISQPLLPFTPDIPTSPTLLATTTIPSSPRVKQTTETPSTTSRELGESGCRRSEYYGGDLEWYPERVDVVFSKNNSSPYANISWTPLTDPAATWTGYLITTYVVGINSQTLYSKKAQCFNLPKNQTFFIVNSSHDWKQSSSIALNVTAYPRPQREVANMVTFYAMKRPPWPEATTPDPIPSASPSPPSKSNVIRTVFLSVGGFCGFTVAAVMLHRRLCRYKLSPKKTGEERFKYHAFIIYSMVDSDLVNNTLIPTLESYNFKLCVHWRDFPPGKVYAENIVESVYNSFKIIAVVSSNFIESPDCGFEIQHAIKRLMDKRDDCLIVIKFDEEGVESLPNTILDRSYIDFTNPNDRSTWESRLVDILSKAIIDNDESIHNTANTNNNNNNNNNNSNRVSESSSTDNEDRNLIVNV